MIRPALMNHQVEAIARAEPLRRPGFGFLMEQGTGKTRAAFEVLVAAFDAGVVDAAIVVTMKAVRRQWVEQFAYHIPDKKLLPIVGVRPKNAEWCRWFDYLRTKYKRVDDKIPMLIVNYETFTTDMGKRAVRVFLDSFRCYFILDESQMIGNPGAKRTKSLTSFSQYAPRRLIMTGTPIADSPFDFYSQFKFVDPTALEFSTYSAFKHNYGEFEQRTFFVGSNRKEVVAEKLLNYRNLNDLVQRTDRFSFRVLKADCLDLPPKVYEKLWVPLSAAQRRLHDGILKKDMEVLLKMKADNPLERMIRMMQIVQNRARLIDGSLVPIVHDLEDPKLSALRDLVITLPLSEKVIVWSPHRHDIQRAAEVLSKIGETVTYDGSTSDADRESAKDRFQNGTARFFVANQSAGGTGLDLWRSSTTVYLANSRKLVERLQSEDRNHRKGTTNHVTYYDIIAEGTIDEIAYQSLMDKKDLSTALLDDRSWLDRFQIGGSSVE